MNPACCLFFPFAFGSYRAHGVKITWMVSLVGERYIVLFSVAWPEFAL